ncbi:hypothetical protein [Nocardia abscessus]|uniref:hypothetical protein n=1 Tax=Nocardia abscessus TaxID=120957 RepID=UPI002458A59B|nr:hypothetical protein [Nocardia abscessus]
MRIQVYIFVNIHDKFANIDLKASKIGVNSQLEPTGRDLIGLVPNPGRITQHRGIRMNRRIIRPLAVAAFTLSAVALGTASAAATTATPVSGSVEVCTGIPVGPVEISFCL